MANAPSRADRFDEGPRYSHGEAGSKDVFSSMKAATATSSTSTVPTISSSASSSSSSSSDPMERPAVPPACDHDDVGVPLTATATTAPKAIGNVGSSLDGKPENAVRRDGNSAAEKEGANGTTEHGGIGVSVGVGVGVGVDLKAPEGVGYTTRSKGARAGKEGRVDGSGGAPQPKGPVGDSDCQGSNEDPRRSPQHLSDYLRKVGDSQREALSRFYHGAVDAPCQRIAMCESNIEEQLSDLNCQQLPFLQFLHHPASQEAVDAELYGVVNGMPRQPPGPQPCEYCGSLPRPTGKGCADDCRRPKLFFLKKKPPFASTEGWNAKTEHLIDPFEGIFPRGRPARAGLTVMEARKEWDGHKSGGEGAVGGSTLSANLEGRTWAASLTARIEIARQRSPSWMHTYF